MLDPKITFLIAAIVRPFLGASRKFGEWLPPLGSLGNLLHRLALRHYPGLFADESPAAVAQDRRPADPARRYFTLQLTESYLTWPLFHQTLVRIERLAWHPT